jgi:EAL domain-containing protein (putative c-di-GMP-specific phosphodiesterase class I)/GGDEF domain-containing protein
LHRTYPYPLISPAVELHRLYVLQASSLLETPPDEALDRITELAGEVLKTPIALLSLIDETRQWFKARVGTTMENASRQDAFCARTILADEVMVVPDAAADPRFAQNRLVLGEPHIRFYAGAPLRTRGGVALGTLCVIDTEPRQEFGDEQRAQLQQMAQLAMDRIQTLRDIAFVDPATRLLNRARFSEDIRLAFEGHDPNVISPSHAVMIDVCSLSYLNQTSTAVGVIATDRLLASIAARIEQALAEHTVYRVSYARYAALVSGGEAAAKRVIDAALRAFDAPLMMKQIPIDLTPCAGLVDLSRLDEHTDVLRALAATSEAARRAGVPVRTFFKRMFATQERTFFILNSLRRALQDDSELHLVYQPRVDLATGRCCGVEALLRWSHPVLGEISPVEFIPLAEKTSLINTLTDWVMERGLKQLATWRKQGYAVKMSINVSVLNLQQPRFALRYASVLQAHGIAPSLCELEVTESVLAGDAEPVIANLRKVSEIGSAIAIDDFGSGYSNLAKLHLYYASVLKIDQSLVRQMLDSAQTRIIVEAIVDLAHKLNYRVVVEGVETLAIQEAVTAWHCDEAQGYAIAKPLAPRMFEAWFARHQIGVANASLPKEAD